MPKISEQYRGARREHILGAARRCFLRDGFHATSMQALFAEADVSAGAVYSYFDSKEDLILAIAEHNMRDVVDQIRVFAVEERGVTVGLAIARVVALLRDRHETEGLGSLAVQVWAEAQRNEQVRARFNTLVSQLRAELVHVVEQHQAAGGLSAEVSATAFANVIIATIAGYIMQLAMLGPEVVEGSPEALTALWG